MPENCIPIFHHDAFLCLGEDFSVWFYRYSPLSLHLSRTRKGRNRGPLYFCFVFSEDGGSVSSRVRRASHAAATKSLLCPGAKMNPRRRRFDCETSLPRKSRRHPEGPLSFKDTRRRPLSKPASFWFVNTAEEISARGGNAQVRCGSADRVVASTAERAITQRRERERERKPRADAGGKCGDVIILTRSAPQVPAIPG